MKLGRPSPGVAYIALLVVTFGFMVYSNDRLGVMSSSIFYMKSQLHISNVQFSLLASAFVFGFLPFPLLSGYLSDKLRTPLIIPISLICFSITTSLIAIATNYQDVFVLRILTGVGEGLFIPAAGGLLGKFFTNRRGLAWGIFNAGFAFGVVSGSLMGGFLGSIYRTYTYNFVFSGLFGFSIAILSVLFIYGYKESVYSSYRAYNQPESVHASRPKIFAKEFFTLGLLLSVAVSFMNSWASTNFILWLAYYLNTVRRIPPSLSSYYSGYAFLFSVAGTILLGAAADKIHKRFGSRALVIVIAAIGSGLFSALLVLVVNNIVAVVMAFGVGFLYSTIYPTSLAIGQDSVDKKYASAATGFNINIQTLSTMIGPVTLALMLSSSFTTAMLFNIALPWFLTGVVAIVFWIVTKHREDKLVTHHGASVGI